MKQIYFALCFLLILSACGENTPPPQQDEIPVATTIIVLSKEKDDERYSNWVRHVDDDFEFVSLYHISPDSVDYFLERAGAVIITGGNDVHPNRYGKEEEIERCGDFDLRRDTLEIKMINYALDNKLPLMGICRGEQITNVATGGTLIIDIPTDFDTTVKHSNGESYLEHWVKLEKSSQLYAICQADSCLVKSYHHQAVDVISPRFNVAGYSNDGLIEAIEYKDSENHPFAFGVQWHPEKMDYSLPYSGPIAVAFVASIRKN